ncbi:hypothetical protein [Flavisolibacter ginsenosidimutans]|uniref:Uncharacterized protein n=1 Tax=Flavisolibacter ginsenosidimutans TaxID=661481 RepID=A0A5B8UPK8_9BACT|nr:hypothetical protein [Flavisolibacter ginsenosidimutans]QEC57980.1 hypothetical protein FSB75_19395 [Flavisolibacter ginsenosidimutans]
MPTYQKFRVGESNSFDPASFPELQPCLQQIVAQLNRESAGPKTEMLLSFVKDHRIKSQLVADHPALANLISTKSLPLAVLEDLFESSRTNPSFRNDLEKFVSAYFAAAPLY